MLNEVRLIGRLGADPNVKEAAGRKVARLSVATWRNYKEGNEWKKVTEWHTVKVWGDDPAKNLHKGDLVYVSGELRTSVYEKDGQKMYATEIIGFVKRITKEAQEVNGSSQEEEDDLPF